MTVYPRKRFQNSISLLVLVIGIQVFTSSAMPQAAPGPQPWGYPFFLWNCNNPRPATPIPLCVGIKVSNHVETGENQFMNCFEFPDGNDWLCLHRYEPKYLLYQPVIKPGRDTTCAEAWSRKINNLPLCLNCDPGVTCAMSVAGVPIGTMNVPPPRGIGNGK